VTISVFVSAQSELGKKIRKAVDDGNWDGLVQFLGSGVDPAVLRHEEWVSVVICRYIDGYLSV
jgi:hypothetical protein